MTSKYQHNSIQTVLNSRDTKQIKVMS